MKQILLFLCYCLCCCFVNIDAILAQSKAKILAPVLTHDFGIIAEESPLVTYVFEIKSVGEAPLVITRVTTSCGCTHPEWTGAPIQPSKSGVVKISYDPNGRPGPFLKTIAVYSNAQQPPYRLAIKGVVTPRKPKPIYTYPYNIGPIKMHKENILFDAIHINETASEKIMLKNDSSEPISISFGTYPSYATIAMNPTTLKPGEEGELSVLLNTAAFDELGRQTFMLPVKIAKEGQIFVEEQIKVSANLLDNFDKWNKQAIETAPKIRIENELLDFGTIEKQGRITKMLTVYNDGDSPLLIHSIGSDVDYISSNGNKKIVKPGNKVNIKFILKTKDIDAPKETLIILISNDPSAPVKRIKATVNI